MNTNSPCASLKKRAATRISSRNGAKFDPEVMGRKPCPRGLRVTVGKEGEDWRGTPFYWPVKLQDAPKLRYEYNPHLPPLLRSSPDPSGVDALPELLAISRQRPLSDAEAKVLADALAKHEPWLEWSGKREKPWFEAEPVALHMHERVSTQAILRVLAREDVERDLFADPQHDYAKAVQFYQHDVDWANRMILGDSLQVMASLARREDLAGCVQMIYLDPPYGIKFASNFQPQLGQRDVKDREQDLTREPEMVKAYRDTWTLGIHSYLAYLRDRLAMARELLADTGSIFVQISDENLHRVRCVMDEVFGVENFVVIIIQQKKGSQKGELIQPINDFILWYAKKKFGAAGSLNVKFRALYDDKLEEDEDSYDRAELPNGEETSAEMARNVKGAQMFVANPLTSGGVRKNQSLPFPFVGRIFSPGEGACWKTTVQTDDGSTPGMTRLAAANRLWVGKDQIRIKAYHSDFGVKKLTNLWTGLGGQKDPIYVVQTNTKVLERCLLMTTDPGDLVLDPTCGSGTTAFVAEQWGRRWITCDSSRVALALAKHRLLTAKFDYYKLRELSAEDVARNPKGTWLSANLTPSPGGEVRGEGGSSSKLTFKCKTVPHITLKSIARNTSLDPIFAKHEPILAEKLAALNREVAKAGAPLKERLVEKLIRKHREQGANAVTDADRRRWLLPDTHPTLIRACPAGKPLKGITPKLRLHMALIRPDVAMGDLLKTQPGSQLFTVFSAPRVKGPTPQKDGDFVVEVEGMDVYDPVSNTLFPTNKERIAAWFLDTDYDGRTFCICQAFFPDKAKWSKLAKALGDVGAVEEDAFDALSGLTSLPFPRPERLKKGEPWRVAVKVIDPRGNEGLRVLTLE
jgi:adenine-specific DNA-methyltransferase